MVELANRTDGTDCLTNRQPSQRTRVGWGVQDGSLGRDYEEPDQIRPISGGGYRNGCEVGFSLDASGASQAELVVIYWNPFEEHPLGAIR